LIFKEFIKQLNRFAEQNPKLLEDDCEIKLDVRIETQPGIFVECLCDANYLSEHFFSNTFIIGGKGAI
jgi:hypothetical protein